MVASVRSDYRWIDNREITTMTEPSDLLGDGETYEPLTGRKVAYLYWIVAGVLITAAYDPGVDGARESAKRRLTGYVVDRIKRAFQMDDGTNPRAVSDSGDLPLLSDPVAPPA